jgi:hypothetical protein
MPRSLKGGLMRASQFELTCRRSALRHSPNLRRAFDFFVMQPIHREVYVPGTPNEQASHKNKTVMLRDNSQAAICLKA